MESGIRVIIMKTIKYQVYHHVDDRLWDQVDDQLDEELS